MMKQEFEKIAKVEVTNEQYAAIEKLYMESSLQKAEFIKTIKPMLKTLRKPEKKEGIVRIAVVVVKLFCNILIRFLSARITYISKLDKTYENLTSMGGL